MLDEEVGPSLVVPGDVKPPLDYPLADSPDVLGADIEAIIPEPEALSAIPFVQQFHLIDHFFGVAGAPWGAPKAPLRAEGAPVRAAATGEQGGELAEDGEVVALHRQEVVCWHREAIHIDGGLGRRDYDFVTLAQGDSLHYGRVTPSLQAAQKLRQGALTLPAHHNVDLSVPSQGLFRGEGDVGATQQGDDVWICLFGDLHHPKRFLEEGGQRGGAHDIGLPIANDCLKLLPIYFLGVAIDDVYLSALLFEHRRQVSEAQRWRDANTHELPGPLWGLNQ